MITSHSSSPRVNSFILHTVYTTSSTGSKQVFIERAEEGLVDPAVVGGGSCNSEGTWAEESRLCVYHRCKRAFLGRQGSGKAPLEDKRHSQQRPEGNKIQHPGKSTRSGQGKNHKKLLQKGLPAPASPSRMQHQLPRDSLLYICRILHFVWDIKQIQLGERTMVAGAASESHRNNSCTINTVKDNQKNLILGLFQEESLRNNTLPRRKKKSMIPPSFAFFQTVKGTPDWPLGSTSPAVLPSVHKCFRQKCSILQNNKKGKVKVRFFFQKCHFQHSFLHLVFFYIQFKVHGWGKLFIVCLFRISSFCYLLISFVSNKVTLIRLLCCCLKQEPFCLASVAFGTAFPGR